jgi:hypothetical protein
LQCFAKVRDTLCEKEKLGLILIYFVVGFSLLFFPVLSMPLLFALLSLSFLIRSMSLLVLLYFNFSSRFSVARICKTFSFKNKRQSLLLSTTVLCHGLLSGLVNKMQSLRNPFSLRRRTNLQLIRVAFVGNFQKTSLTEQPNTGDLRCFCSQFPNFHV